MHEPVDLLDEPIISTETGCFSLAGLLAASARGDIATFPRLRAHQRTAWHSFRVQLAALAMRKGSFAEPPEDEATWAELLRVLTPEHETAWHLVAERGKPAFMQPPDPGGLKWESVTTPDALDMLITARNHDLKAAIADDATAEDWVFALVTLQTSEGYGGKFNYGIARMNGGSSSRPFLGLAPATSGGAPDLSAWWRRDVAVLLRSQDEPIALTPGGPALLWCEPWAQGEAIPAHRIDPWAIEVCRRVRLITKRGRVQAERTGSTTPRIEAKAFHGVLGDPWTPVTKAESEPKALTLGEGQFDYRRIVDLMFSGNWAIPAAATVQPVEVAGEMVLVAEALSRGNSKTDGLKSRTVPMPERAQGLFLDDPTLLADAAARQIEDVAGATKALQEAVALYAAGGDRDKVGKDHRLRAAPAKARLERAVDAVFFEHLWEHAAPPPDATGEEARERFRQHLVATARAQLERAFEAIACATINAPRARVRARARLEAGLRKAALVEARRIRPEESPAHV